MSDPKHQPGQAVEAQYNNSVGFVPVIIERVETRHVYTVRYKGGGPDWMRGLGTTTWDRNEDQIRLPRPSPEEAWEKAQLLIGKRAQLKGSPSSISPFNEGFDKETRHQVYQILGSASIRITDEVKRDVRRLIGVADGM